MALQTARAAGMPEDKLPEVIVSPEGAPTTTNDAALAQRVRAVMQAGMGADAFADWQQTDMGAEDFPDLVNVDPPIPSVYFEVGGTPPRKLASGEWAEHHSPLFRIEPEPSIKAGVEAMTMAALELLGERETERHRGLVADASQPVRPCRRERRWPLFRWFLAAAGRPPFGPSFGRSGARCEPRLTIGSTLMRGSGW